MFVSVFIFDIWICSTIPDSLFNLLSFFWRCSLFPFLAIESCIGPLHVALVSWTLGTLWYRSYLAERHAGNFIALEGALAVPGILSSSTRTSSGLFTIGLFSLRRLVLCSKISDPQHTTILAQRSITCHLSLVLAPMSLRYLESRDSLP